MQTPIIIIHSGNKLTSQTRVGQSKWQRIILLFVLGYEGAGALLGGSLLVAAPDGGLMDMPVEIMHGSFSNFIIPGIILFALGMANAAAFLQSFVGAVLLGSCQLPLSAR